MYMCICTCTCACRLLPASPASPRTPAPSLMVVVVPARAQHAYDMASRREFVRFGGHTSATTRLCALCEKFIFIRLSSYVYICVVKRCVRLEKKEQSGALPAGRSAHTAAGATAHGRARARRWHGNVASYSGAKLYGGGQRPDRSDRANCRNLCHSCL